MKIKFIGAAGGEVTGSCILCCARNGTQFLVDCGGFQGGGFAEQKNSRFPFDPKSIDFVLLTHAHFDHCGRLPALYDGGFAGKIYCSKATRDLAILNIKDGLRKWNIHVQKAWEGRFITEEEDPRIGGSASFVIDNDLRISLLRSSHFLGANSFVVQWNRYHRILDSGEKVLQTKSVCFSGDLGGVIDDSDNNYLSLIKDGFVPEVWIDYIVMESTYGSRTREPKYKSFDKRIEYLDKLMSDDDVDIFVFPCFAMQRTQDVLFDLLYLALREDKHRFQIVLDSPMGIEACGIFKKALTDLVPDKKGGEKFRYLNDRAKEGFLALLGEDYIKSMNEGVDQEIHAMRKFIRDVLGFKFEHERVKMVLRVRPSSPDPAAPEGWKKVYITSSGMLQAGPVLRHIGSRHACERTAFVLTGFCKSTENGKVLTKWSENPQYKEGSCVGTIWNGEEEIPQRIPRGEFKAKIRSMSSYYSGHADAEGLLRFLLETSKPEKVTPKPEDKKHVSVFLNHGDTIARAALKAQIEERSKTANQLREIKGVILPNATDSFFNLDEEGKQEEASHLLLPVFKVEK